MKKIIVLTAVFLLAAGLGAASDTHAPQRTGKFAIEVSGHGDTVSDVATNAFIDTTTKARGDVVSRVANQHGKTVKELADQLINTHHGQSGEETPVKEGSEVIYGK